MSVAPDPFAARCATLIEAQRGKPFTKAPIDHDWNDRGNFTRNYAHSVTTYAMQAFHLEEGVGVANDALGELCRHYLDHPIDLLEAHSFHWSGALYNRLWSFFGPDGSISANRMSPETQALLLEVMWTWSSNASPALDPDPDHIWHVPNSENHHVMGMVTTWGFCDALRKHASYADRPFEDGRTAGQHHEAWSAYLAACFRARAGKGQMVEIASKNYNAHTIQMWYNVVDFAEDPDLARRAEHFLDLYWATWAEEHVDGARGGGKTRIYQGPASRTAGGGAVQAMAERHLGDRPGQEMDAQDWVIATSRYRMPGFVARLASEPDARGEYEVKQRCMGLSEEGWKRKSNPPVVPFGTMSFREDFGGFLRYTYGTPDFVMGTLMLEPRPRNQWNPVAAQNRWQGVTFRGHPDAAIVPECLAVDRERNLNHHANTMNQHWSVQRKGTLITQKLKGPEYSDQAGKSRVWISGRGLSNPVEAGGWVVVESAGAFAGIRMVDGYTWDDPAKGEVGHWLKCESDLSPILLEVQRKRDGDSLDCFASRLAERALSFENTVLRYEGLSGDVFTFYTDYSALPEINGAPVDLAPPKVYDSPFVQSDWDSGVVEIRYGDATKTLDFTI